MSSVTVERAESTKYQMSVAGEESPRNAHDHNKPIQNGSRICFRVMLEIPREKMYIPCGQTPQRSEISEISMGGIEVPRKGGMSCSGGTDPQGKSDGFFSLAVKPTAKRDQRGMYPSRGVNGPMDWVAARNSPLRKRVAGRAAGRRTGRWSSTPVCVVLNRAKVGREVLPKQCNTGMDAIVTEYGEDGWRSNRQSKHVNTVSWMTVCGRSM